MHKSGTRTSNYVDTLFGTEAGAEGGFLRGKKEPVHVLWDSVVGGELGQPIKMIISEHVCQRACVSLPLSVVPPVSGRLSCSKTAPMCGLNICFHQRWSSLASNLDSSQG